MQMGARLTALGLIAAALLFVHGPAAAADHRDAPRVDEDYTADINDIYAFRSPADSTQLVLIMTTHPLSDPNFATSYHYPHDVLYRFHVGNMTKAITTSKIDFLFSKYDGTGQTFNAFFPGGIKVQGQVTQPTVTSDTPNTPIIVNGPAGSNIKIFVGPRDDPFFFDLVGFNRFIAGTGEFTGVDRFAGFNVSAIVVQLPVALVSGGAVKLQVWGSTHRGTLRPHGLEQASGPGFVYANPQEFDETSAAAGAITQIDRMGNPAVNTALIPFALKDAFNSGQPRHDARDFASAIVGTLKHLGTSQSNINILASVAVPDTLKLDTTQPDGFPNGRRLQDRVIDTLLTLITNGSVTTDGTPGNDVPFLDTFPYAAPPHQATGTSPTLSQ